MDEEMNSSMKKQALIMAVNCVRNTVIEDYHAAGKISDPEMMVFNKEVVNKLYTFMLYISSPDKSKVFHEAMCLFDPVNWDEPEIDKEFASLVEDVGKTLERVRILKKSHSK